LICDRKRLISPHAFYLGVSGSGKSMAMKSTIENVALATNDDIIITSVAKDRKAPSGGKSRTREADDAAIFA